MSNTSIDIRNKEHKFYLSEEKHETSSRSSNIGHSLIGTQVVFGGHEPCNNKKVNLKVMINKKKLNV